MNRDTEPVRLPLWAATILVTAIQVALDLLSDVQWKAAVAKALTSALLLLGGTEAARSRAYSPATVRRIRSHKRQTAK